MRKRLRKKKHLGEFTILGFEIKGTWKRSIDFRAASEEAKVTWNKEQDDFLDALIAFVEARDLCVGGGGNMKTFGYYVTKGRYAVGKHPRKWVDVCASEEDVAMLAAYLSSHEMVATSKAGPLTDAWNGDFEDEEEAA